MKSLFILKEGTKTMKLNLSKLKYLKNEAAFKIYKHLLNNNKLKAQEIADQLNLSRKNVNKILNVLFLSELLKIEGVGRSLFWIAQRHEYEPSIELLNSIIDSLQNYSDEEICQILNITKKTLKKYRSK